MGPVERELWLTATEAWVTVVTATVVYLAVIALSRIFGQRQLSNSSSYDMAFVFALGSLVGRVVLVRTSLAVALLGLTTMFVLHAGTGWLHHHVGWIHDLLQNDPVLLVAEGRVVDEGMRAAHVSDAELMQALRLHGRHSLDGVAAAILERSGGISVLSEPPTDVVLDGVRFRERLARSGP